MHHFVSKNGLSQYRRLFEDHLTKSVRNRITVVCSGFDTTAKQAPIIYKSLIFNSSLSKLLQSFYWKCGFAFSPRFSFSSAFLPRTRMACPPQKRQKPLQKPTHHRNNLPRKAVSCTTRRLVVGTLSLLLPRRTSGRGKHRREKARHFPH